MSGNPRFRLVSGRGLGERSTPIQAGATPSPQPPLQTIKLEPQTIKLEPLQEDDANVPSPSNAPSQNPQVNQIQFMDRMGPGSPMESGQAGALKSESDEQAISKCVRFFKTLLNLSKNPEQQNADPDQRQNTSQKVKDLVTGVIIGTVPPEEFTRSLQSCLRSQAQPHLLPFLRKTLPSLRDHVKLGLVRIEGIEMPPEWMIENNIEENIPTSEMLPQQIAASGPINMFKVPVSMPLATSVPQNVNDVEMEEHREEDAIQVRALQENALKAALIRPEDVMKRITDRMKEACYVEEEVLTLISDAAEYRLREMLAELAVLAEHRMDNLRMSMTYAPIDDVKGQIRFLENLDRQQFEQNENREKEALIRLSKGKGMAKETIEKAKEMQRIDAEAKRNRDANAAAIAALSSKSSKPRWDNPTASAAGGGHTMRLKTIRVNIRDLQAFVNNDPLCARSHIIHKLSLGGGTQAEPL